MSFPNIEISKREATLPSWLDDLIFKKMGGQYCRCNSDMTVIDWGPADILKYLGTYFPRSFTESYCIFNHLLLNADTYSNMDCIKLLDFGCGTGGEIIGFATALSEHRHNIKVLRIKAIDGNQYALKKFEEIKDEFNRRHSLQIICCPSPVRIDDFYDLSVLDSILDLDYNYDLVLSFKAVCEFVTKKQFREKNAYEYLTKFMLPRIADNGNMLMLDVSTKNNVAQEWLPNLMDEGLRGADVSIIESNSGYNDLFIVNHSRKTGDISKVVWRLISK